MHKGQKAHVQSIRNLRYISRHVRHQKFFFASKIVVSELFQNAISFAW
jgi:hypothetical protein